MSTVKETVATASTRLSTRCRGPMRVIACIEEQDVAKKILSHLGLPAEPLPTARAHAPPMTLELFPSA